MNLLFGTTVKAFNDAVSSKLGKDAKDAKPMYFGFKTLSPGTGDVTV